MLSPDRGACAYEWDSGVYEDDELSGPLMQFRLVYEGPLSSAAKKDGGKAQKERHAIRRVIHRQLKHLWNTHPTLLGMQKREEEGYESELDILGNIHKKCDRRFIPLVNETKNLVCSIDVLFLRRQDPGGVLTQRGDLDNRLSQLFDALTIPRTCEGVAPPVEGEDPFFCLLEDDSLVTGFTVSSDRLYAEPRARHLLPEYYGIIDTGAGVPEPDGEGLRYHEDDVLPENGASS